MKSGLIESCKQVSFVLYDVLSIYPVVAIIHGVYFTILFTLHKPFHVDVHQSMSVEFVIRPSVLSQENETWILHNIVKQYWIIRQWIICLSVDLYITVIIITWFDAQRHDIWVLMTGDRSDSLQGSSVSIYNLKRSAFPLYLLRNSIVSLSIG